MLKPDLNMMRAAIEAAEANKTPFGAAIAMGDEIFVTAANQTEELHDPAAHAEICAIRELGVHLKKTDLSGFTLYTTCEPCPMCMGAVIRARINTVFYGCDISVITNYLPQIGIRAAELNLHSFFTTEIKGGLLNEECLKLLKQYS